MDRPIESNYNSHVAYTRALEAYCDSLAQPEQEPDDMTIAYMSGLYDGKKKRPWVGLTQNDIYKISEKCGLMDAAWEDVMNAVEAKLKEKNT